MATSSTRKTPQISQFKAYATVSHPPSASDSRIKTGINSSVAANTIGSNGV
jgi:hypothetical protein